MLYWLFRNIVFQNKLFLLPVHIRGSICSVHCLTKKNISNKLRLVLNNKVINQVCIFYLNSAVHFSNGEEQSTVAVITG